MTEESMTRSEKLFRQAVEPPPFRDYSFGSVRDIRDAVLTQSRMALELLLELSLELPER